MRISLLADVTNLDWRIIAYTALIVYLGFLQEPLIWETWYTQSVTIGFSSPVVENVRPLFPVNMEFPVSLKCLLLRPHLHFTNDYPRMPIATKIHSEQISLPLISAEGSGLQ